MIITNRLGFLFLTLVFPSISVSLASDLIIIKKAPTRVINEANSTLLPSPLPLWVIENYGVVNRPTPGARKILLPTDNSYGGVPGCYIACYSHKEGVFAVAPDINVLGQVRVKGIYTGRFCQPIGYQGVDISGADEFQTLCSQKIAPCKNNECWAGGDTGGWFGLP